VTAEPPASRLAPASRVAVAGASDAGPRAPLAMIRTIWRARAVVRALVARDLRSRYVGSTFGAVWSLAHPLLQLATLSFVFATVLKVRITGVGGTDVPFVLYLACGLFPWLAIQEGVLRSATSMVDNPTLVKRVVFPVETLPVQLAFAAVVHQLVATMVLLVLMAILGFPPRPSLLALPALLVPQLLITIGLGWAMAAMHVYFRDTAQALGVLLPVWFYLTPIIYPSALVPPMLQPVIAANPLTPLVDGYRDLLLHGTVPGGLGALWLAAASLVVFAAGAIVFARARGEFADLV
jgi:lipopolysaccharide transport system permease protein